jgi:hypothetical protein
MEVKNNTKKKLISNNANNIITSPKNEPEENLDNFITKIIKTYTIK